MGQPYLALGSSGGSAIPGYVLQQIISVIDWGMDVQEAVNAPHILNRGIGIEMEPGAEALKPALEAMGHPVETRDLTSGLTAIRFMGGLYIGAADPRREGVPKGE
jgi:gamma-glutamyltranspeptidase/glutathione hydrolase